MATQEELTPRQRFEASGGDFEATQRSAQQAIEQQALSEGKTVMASQLEQAGNRGVLGTDQLKAAEEAVRRPELAPSTAAGLLSENRPQVTRATDVTPISGGDTGGAGGAGGNEAFIQAVNELKRIREEEAQQEKATADAVRAGRGVDVTSTADVLDLPSLTEFTAQTTAGKEQIKIEELKDIAAKSGAQEQISLLNEIKTLQDEITARRVARQEQFLNENGTDLSDEEKQKIRRRGQEQIDLIEISRDSQMAEIDYAKKKLERDFNRAVTAQEQFNVQQDAKLRRMANLFGADMGTAANAGIVQENRKNQQILNDLRSEFSDRSMLFQERANAIIDTSTTNIRQVTNATEDELSNKYIEVQDRIDDLLDQGMLDAIEIQKEIAGLQNDYVKTYIGGLERIQNIMQTENQAIQDQIEAERTTELANKKQAIGFLAKEPMSILQLSDSELQTLAADGFQPQVSAILAAARIAQNEAAKRSTGTGTVVKVKDVRSLGDDQVITTFSDGTQSITNVDGYSRAVQEGAAATTPTAAPAATLKDAVQAYSNAVTAGGDRLTAAQQLDDSLSALNMTEAQRLQFLNREGFTLENGQVVKK